VFAVQHWGPSALFISYCVLVILIFLGTFSTFWEIRSSQSFRDWSFCSSHNFFNINLINNRNSLNDDNIFCLLFNCVLYQIQLVEPCALGSSSMACLVTRANWFSNFWIHIEIHDDRTTYNKFWKPFFDNLFGQKWLFRLFLHFTYQSTRNPVFCSLHDRGRKGSV